MKSIIRRFFILSLLSFQFFLNPKFVNSQSPKLFINEFMASNQKTVMDNNGEYNDWIEIYNGENFDINLFSYYLTDNLIFPLKWGFPNVVIPAKGYLLIWADDNLNQSGLHANFKLDKNGEQIGLYNGISFVDSITYGQQYTDVSSGRKSDGDSGWVFFEPPNNPPTPGDTNSYIDVATLDPPKFSPDEGFYTGSISVELSTDEPEAVIYYTLDGRIPTASSMQYASKINIAVPTTIRAISYKKIIGSDDLISHVVTKCYILNIQHALPQINVVCDPVEFDEIYNPSFYQPGKQHPSMSAHFKYFDSNNILQGDLPISFSLHGGYSFASPKKSHKIVFTDQDFQYDLFDQQYLYPRPPDLPSSFKSFDLIGMAADYSLIRNYLSMQLLRNAGLNSPQVTFIRLFINGNDRGIYVPIECIDSRYMKNHGFEPGNYDIIKTGCEHKCDLTLKNLNGQYFEIKEGDFVAFEEFLQWLNQYGHNYDELIKRIDIQSFLYYDMMCRFSNNRDSYDINYYLIKNRDIPDSKWIIFLWDTDESFGWDGNFDGRWFRYNYLFDRLWQCESYVHLFYNTLADLLNTKWSYQEADTLIQNIQNLFQTDNAADEAIWNSAWYDYADVTIPDFREDPQYNPLSRYRHLNFLKEWVKKRIDFVFERFRWRGGKAQLTIEPPTGGNGSIKLNSLHLTNFPWTGTYFREIPISLKAIPKPGYVFVGWSDSSVSQTEQISITLSGDYAIHAIFQLNTQIDRLVINEINYNSAPNFNTKDWIELYNSSDQTAKLSGWHLKDDDNTHDFVFPNETTIDPYHFLVICSDTTAFHNLFPGATRYIGNMDFGFAGGGDQVRIFNALGLLIDSVAYDDRAPWTSLPDGNGPTLELIDPDWNNTLPENWHASLWHGTPGQKNSFRIVINEINYNSAADFNPDDWIELYNPSARAVDVSGWHLKDDNNIDDFRFPDGTTIAPNGFLIVCYDKTAFQALFPTVTNFIGNFNFGLNGGGDDIKIYNESYNLVDSVTYDDDKPWAIEADSTGPTLELLDPESDNTIALNWQASAGHGSPGQPTLALPVVTRVVVRDSSGSRVVTNSRDILIEMTATDYDGRIIKWLVNETNLPPLPGNFVFENRPSSYHIESEAGDVTIYGWALDNDNQVSRLTDTSKTTIRLVFRESLVNVTGTVNYINEERPLPNAIMTLNYAHVTDSDTTDESGVYAFTEVESGNVKLKPSRVGDIGDAIMGSDVLFVLQYLASLINMTDAEKLAADVIEDGNVNDADVQAILRHLTYHNDNIGNAGRWRFVPNEFSFNLKSDTTVNFKGYLIGDANLDWVFGSNSGQQNGRDSLYSDVILKLNQVDTHNQKYIELPLIVETDSEAVNTIIFSLHYDPIYLIYETAQPTDLTNDFKMAVNGTQTGKLHVAMAGLPGIISSDEILKIRFEVVDPSIRNQYTSLTFIRALVNDQPAKTANGEIIFTDISDIEPLPEDFALYQNFPNPFNSETQVHYRLPEPADVRITIYNLMGNEIRTIVNEKNKPAGSYLVIWNGKDNYGSEMSSGIFIYQFRTNRFNQSKKMIMIK